MAEINTRESRALSLSPERYLTAPGNCPINGTHNRAVSSAPSYRSTQSHVTTFEEKEDFEGVNSPEFRKRQVQRQQTYKIGRSIGLMDRIKGVFFPKMLLSKMEDSIEVVTSDVPNDEMFHRQESPWIVHVHVSPKVDSANYHKTLCLLDTGCSHGNIVSKEFVDALGFTEVDYQELSELESHGGVTMAGEPLPIEAAIFLSWHHNTSLKRVRQMRFLISSQAKSFNMIIGAQTICKYNLLSRPVFNLDNGIVRPLSNGGDVNRLIKEKAALMSDIETNQELIEDEKNEQKLAQLGVHRSELKHLLSLKESEIAREQAEEADKKTFDVVIDNLSKAWDIENPKNTTEMVKAHYQASRNRVTPSHVPAASSST